MKKTVAAFLTVVMILAGTVAVSSVTSDAKTTTKNIVIASLSSNSLSYHKSCMNTQLNGDADWQWENLVGYGKKQRVAVAKNCKYYSISLTTMKPYKTSKAKFKKNLKDYSKNKENGVVWYWGTAAKITIKNGKCVKIVQTYQA